MAYINFKDEIFRYLYELFLEFGLSSRTLLLFMRDGFYLSGRENIYENVISAILESPLIGLGIAGDRRVLGGSYAHNLFIELVANFGILIGLLISLIVVFIILRGLLSKSKAKYNMLIMWISPGFVHLMVSGSYFIDMKFWILIGLSMNKMIFRNEER